MYATIETIIQFRKMEYMLLQLFSKLFGSKTSLNFKVQLILIVLIANLISSYPTLSQTEESELLRIMKTENNLTKLDEHGHPIRFHQWYHSVVSRALPMVEPTTVSPELIHESDMRLRFMMQPKRDDANVAIPGRISDENAMSMRRDIQHGKYQSLPI